MVKGEPYANYLPVKPAPRGWFTYRSTPGALSIDDWVSRFFVGGIAIFSCGPLLTSIQYLFASHPGGRNIGFALPLLEVINNLCSIVLYLGILLLWATLCYGEEAEQKAAGQDSGLHRFIRSFWNKGITLFGKKQNFMPGGFTPAPFALVMSILILFTGNCVSSNVLPGAMFVKFTNPVSSRKFVGWPLGMSCRADDKVPADAAKTWLSRFRVQHPAGCYGVTTLGQFADADSNSSKTSKILPHWLINIVGSSTEANSFYTKPGKDIPNLAVPFGPDGKTLDKTHKCKYQCAKWKGLSIQGFLMKSGSIFTGALFIERFTNKFTSGRGSPFITVDSSPQDVERAIRKTLGMPVVKHGEIAKLRQNFFRHLRQLNHCRLWVLCILASIGLFASTMTPRLAINGFYTVDYYVTLVFLFSALSSWMLRIWNPYSGVRMVYTSRLWSTGEDEFSDGGLGVGQKKDLGKRDTVSLYDWFHHKPERRAQWLLEYARRVDVKKVKIYHEEAGPKTALLNKKPESLKERLDGLETRVVQLEGDKPTEKAKAQEGGDKAPEKKAKEGQSFVDTICNWFNNYFFGSKKSGVGNDSIVKLVTDTEQWVTFEFEKVKADGTKRTWTRRRARVQVNATGKVLGKTREGLLVVQFGRTDKVELDAEQGEDDDRKREVILQLEEDKVVENGEDWQELEAKYNLALDGNQRDDEEQTDQQFCAKNGKEVSKFWQTSGSAV